MSYASLERVFVGKPYTGNPYLRFDEGTEALTGLLPLYVCHAVPSTWRFKSSHTRTHAGVCSQTQGVRREAESERRAANVQAETTSEPEVAFHIDDPP